MGFTDNTLKDACNYFKGELESTYDESELSQVLQISFFHFFGWSRTDIVLNQDHILSEGNKQKLIELVSELKKDKPLAQIIGEWEFYGLKFKVNEHTLIPRPETEELVQLIVNENGEHDNLNILDIGTGTGCIPISLKNELKNTNITAFDVSNEALKIAKKNAALNNLEVNFKKVDILGADNQDLISELDIIVSNPPYIPQKEKELMHKNVLDFEPELALFVDDTEPLLFYDKIADFALHHLKQNGKLYFEINENYGQETKQLLINKGFKNVLVIKDLNEKDRMIKALR